MSYADFRTGVGSRRSCAPSAQRPIQATRGCPRVTGTTPSARLRAWESHQQARGVKRGRIATNVARGNRSVRGRRGRTDRGVVGRVVPSDGQDGVPASVPSSPYRLRSLSASGKVLLDAGSTCSPRTSAPAARGHVHRSGRSECATVELVLGGGSLRERLAQATAREAPRPAPGVPCPAWPAAHSPLARHRSGHEGPPGDHRYQRERQGLALGVHRDESRSCEPGGRSARGEQEVPRPGHGQ